MKTDELENLTVLIVDDQYDNVTLLEGILAMQYNVETRKSGMEALEFVANNKTDLILLDIMMPEMNGFTVCRKLKQDSATKEIPIIFITALDDLEYKIEGFSVGGVDYITKPFQQEEVLRRVETHLTIRKQNENLRRIAEELDESNKRLEFSNKTLKEKLIQIKKVNEEKFESELKLKSVLSNLDILIWSIDSDGLINYVDGVSSENSIVLNKNMVGQLYIKTFKKYPLIIDGIRKAIANTSSQREITIKDKTFQVIFNPKSSINTENGGMVGVAFDISRLKKTENALIEAKDNIERAGKERSQLIANISRQLMVPLNNISQKLSLVKSIQQDNFDLFLDFKSNISIVERTVNSLNKLSICELQKEPTKKTLLNICDLIGDVVRDCSINTKIEFVKQQTSVFALGNHENTTILIKNTLLAILNLFGTNELKISCHVVPSLNVDGVFEIYIKYIGYAESIDKNTFEKIKFGSDHLFEIKNDNIELLDILLTKCLLKNENASFSSKITTGDNVEFSLLLTKLCLCDGVGNTLQPDDRDYDRFDLKYSRVLIAEDNPATVETIEKYLSSKITNIYKASNGQEVVIMARKEQPELILMDITLPVISGLQAVAILKNQESLRNIPIVAMVSTDSELKSEETVNFKAVIRKPFTKRQLIKTILALDDL